MSSINPFDKIEQEQEYYKLHIGDILERQVKGSNGKNKKYLYMIVDKGEHDNEYSIKGEHDNEYSIKLHPFTDSKENSLVGLLLLCHAIFFLLQIISLRIDLCNRKNL
jgi:hypothetical protein